MAQEIAIPNILASLGDAAGRRPAARTLVARKAQRRAATPDTRQFGDEADRCARVFLTRAAGIRTAWCVSVERTC